MGLGTICFSPVLKDQWDLLCIPMSGGVRAIAPGLKYLKAQLCLSHPMACPRERMSCDTHGAGLLFPPTPWPSHAPAAVRHHQGAKLVATAPPCYAVLPHNADDIWYQHTATWAVGYMTLLMPCLQHSCGTRKPPVLSLGSLPMLHPPQPMHTRM